MARPRVVLVSPLVAYNEVPHAGGRYLVALYRLLEAETDLTVLSPGSRTNREAATRPGAPAGLVLLGLEPERSLPGRVLNRLSLRGDMLVRRLDPGAPYLPFLTSLLTSPSARAAVRTADVIDLQWSESVRLARVMRRLNPRARIVGTFHDVQSQLFAREPARWRGDGLYWRLVAGRSRRLERRMVRRLDEVLVFSAKDAALLGDPSSARVVPPPVMGGTARHVSPVGAGVLVVSYLARAENDDAARWLLTEIWPRVHARVPGATLTLAGAGASEEVRDLAAGDGSVRLPGFVDDLDEMYAAATVALVPLRQGAGVKFKTIEALLRGVPVVSTAVGAEGIEGDDLFAGVGDDVGAMVEALVDVLTDPGRFRDRADAAQRWAHGTYGHDAFAAAVRLSWSPR